VEVGGYAYTQTDPQGGSTGRAADTSLSIVPSRADFARRRTLPKKPKTDEKIPKKTKIRLLLMTIY